MKNFCLQSYDRSSSAYAFFEAPIFKARIFGRALARAHVFFVEKTIGLKCEEQSKLCIVVNQQRSQRDNVLHHYLAGRHDTVLCIIEGDRGG